MNQVRDTTLRLGTVLSMLGIVWLSQVTGTVTWLHVAGLIAWGLALLVLAYPHEPIVTDRLSWRRRLAERFSWRGLAQWIGGILVLAGFWASIDLWNKRAATWQEVQTVLWGFALIWIMGFFLFHLVTLCFLADAGNESEQP